MRYSCGDIVLVLFPDSNLRTAKRRTVLVVMADDLNTGLQQTIIAMITSNMNRAGHPSRVAVMRDSAQGRQMGLMADSVIATDNLATVRESEIDRMIGTCPEMQTIDSALRRTLGLQSI
jgi:mRNA interferase MazF